MKPMAHYRLLGLLIVAAFELKTCSSESSLAGSTRLPSLRREGDIITSKMDTMLPLTSEDSTPPSLKQEVEDNSRYKILEANATLLKLLVNHNSGVSRSEVFDMLHSRDDNQEHMDLPAFPDDMESARVDVTMRGSPDSQAEFLQTPDRLVRKDSARLRMPRGGAGAAAGIMVATTCAIVSIAYAGLLLYRRIYLKRNGLKHELLRNEENIAETRIEL